MISLGNKKILELRKTAFLCSRQYPSNIVPKVYDWAIAQREAGSCIISGFHSQIEKDVFHYLLKGMQPIILALARGLPKKPEMEMLSHIESGRLLLIAPFDNSIIRITGKTAPTRNQLMIDIADEIIVDYVSAKGFLNKLISASMKRITKL